MQITIEDVLNIMIICLICGFFSSLLVDTIKKELNLW